MHTAMTEKSYITKEHGAQLGNIEILWGHNSKDVFFANTIIIHDGNTTVVDASANFSVLEALASRKVVKYALNTHYHLDHRSLTGLFKDATFICHEADKKVMSHFENYLKYADNTEDSFYRGWLKTIFQSLDIMERNISKTLQDHERLDLTENDVEVIHLPGHTPGHIGLLFHDVSLFFSADIDLTPHGPWYGNIGSDIDEYISSLLKAQAIEVEHYATSHGRRIYSREQFIKKTHRYLKMIHDRDDQILSNLKSAPKNFEELCQIGIIHKQSQLKNPLTASFEAQMLGKHLERLAKKSIVHSDGSRWLLS